MRYRGLTVLMTIVLAYAGANAGQRQDSSHASGKMTAESAIQNWKAMPKEVAQKMIQKYGQPQEVTSERLIWHNNGPWKLTELVNEELDHRFPMPHKDMLRQVINYRVPVDKFDDLAKYDGSVIVERTKGEIAARCDKEEANFLALNLANDIARGDKTVDQARKFYAEAIAEKKHPEYMAGLRFMPEKSGQADADEPEAKSDQSKKD
jgi:hypothetical protein